ncbi:MAG TPA: hypothetical protein GXX57_11175 [Firmicutes bacterium]|nr:hypothetical protein [Bacillota bacterium]
MGRSYLWYFALCSVLVLFSLGASMSIKAQERVLYQYLQDFEEEDPFQLFKSDGAYTVHFKGLTTEKAFAGERSFKLDVTIESGSYVYWAIPVSVPGEGNLTFRARILRPEASQGRVGLGLQATVVPVGYSRARAFWEYGATDDAWQKFEYTWVDTFARGTAVSFASSELWQGKSGEVGCYLDQILVMLQGQPGDRIVCYLDAVELSGEVPATFVYEETVAERWRGVTTRTQEQLAVWQSRLDDVAAVLAQDAAQVPAELVSQIQERYDAARELLAQIQVRGWILTEEPERVGLALAELERMTTLMVTLAENKGIGERGSAGIIYVVPPISTIKILPTDRPEHGKIAKDLQVVATPGEFEPASFVVFALDEITGCRPTPGDLVGEMGTIPASAVEIKIVQRWFQAGTAWWGRDQDKTKRVLVPELLVNDPTLVKVDYENQENYLKLSFASHEEYVRISNPADVGGRQQLSINAWPVKDSPVLLPVDIPAGTNQQFWITIKVPADASPGVYTGPIYLYGSGGMLGELTLTLRVLPFTLLPPYYTPSIYYRGVLDLQGPGTISSEKKSLVQFRAELQNMLDHGVTNPIVYQPLSSLEEVLKIRDEIGMGNQPLYYLGVQTHDSTALLKGTLELAAKYNIPEVYFYGIDEAAGEALVAQRDNWIRVREAGGKVFAASWQDGNFELMGDLQDLHIRHDRLRPHEAAKWHSVGKKIWSYGNPQTPAEDPELYRRNYGLMIWTNDYDGVAPYAYQDGFGNIWNDFDHPSYRDHNFTYPTVDGAIDTIAWEGFREGVDDVRYLTTLLTAIETAKTTDDAVLLSRAAEAEKYLSRLNPARNLDEIRQEMIYHILRLRKDPLAEEFAPEL